jgi:hypothetical protein
MFDQTWAWAGKFRWKQTNIGVAPEGIQNELGSLLGDVCIGLKIRHLQSKKFGPDPLKSQIKAEAREFFMEAGLVSHYYYSPKWTIRHLFLGKVGSRRGVRK